jgi:putative NADH-flavin reductase
LALILVIGASHGIGLETVKAALAAGHDVRAFARSAQSIPLAHPKLCKITGDALKRADVVAALPGVDAVIQSIGANAVTDLIFGTKLFSNATHVMVEAMQAAGVCRLLTVTGLGAGNSRGRINFIYDNLIFPVVLQRVYDDKDIAEDIVMKSGLDWTIARPGLLTNEPATGRYNVLTEMRDWRAGSISRADVADFLVEHVDDKTLFGATPLLID